MPDWLVEHARGMGAGDAGSFGGRFGGKDIRRGKVNFQLIVCSVEFQETANVLYLCCLGL